MLVLLLSSVTNAQISSAACSTNSASAFATDTSISNNQVLVCATATQQKSAASTTSTKSSVKSTAKPTESKSVAVLSAPSNCPTAVATTAQIVAAALAGCKIPSPSLPTAMPKPPASVKVAEKITTKVKTANSLASQSDQALFSAQPLSIQASVAMAQTGESVILTSDAREHERAGAILGRTGYVRFVPVAYFWSISVEPGSPVAVASFSAAGPKNISLRVVYLASSRFSLSEPWQLIGEVFAFAETRLEIVEPAKPPNAAPPASAKVVPRLVFASCETMPSAYRC